MYLYHYFEKGRLPFLSITALPMNKAKETLEKLNTGLPDIEFFLSCRYEMEKNVRDQFIAIGGKPVLSAPIYFTLGENKNMTTWFKNPDFIRIPIEEFDMDKISFTYGDMFPVFNPKLNTGEEWWGKVYKYDEILELIEKYGYPEDPEYNMCKREFPKDKPIRDYLKYIEAQVWYDDVLKKYDTAL